MLIGRYLCTVVPFIHSFASCSFTYLKSTKVWKY
jgi:hypothetical protein